MRKTGVLLVNVGTPDSPSTKDVRKYLREFLMDPYVIDIPFISRFVLVNGIIAPFRAPKSAKIYQEIWNERGSPLKYHGIDTVKALQNELGEDYSVKLGMRYQNPSLKNVIQEFKNEQIEKLICIPLFPQFAKATTQTVIDEVNKLVSEENSFCTVQFVQQFFENNLFLEAFTEVAQKKQIEEFDHIIFSYHGLPERQILKASDSNYCQLNGVCCSKYHAKNTQCYRAQCFETSRLLAKRLHLTDNQYTVGFQSRLGKSEWIKPYLENVIDDLLAKNIKRVLVVVPSFIADCIETTIEIGEEYKELFEEKGGNKWVLAESLNSSKLWIDCLKKLVYTSS